MIEMFPKLYFIISYEKSSESKIEISADTPGFTNFRTEIIDSIRIKDRDYAISIKSFDMVKKDVKKNKEDGKYKLILKLKYNNFPFNNTYEGEITLEEIRNTFIYFFKFNESNDHFLLFNTKKAPPTNNNQLSYLEQFMLYKKFLVSKKYSEQGDPLSNALIEDSLNYIIENGKDNKHIFNLEDYLELLIFCHKTDKIKTLLEIFNIKKCDLNDLHINDSKNYSVILDKMEASPEIYTKYCFKSEEENECKKNFYSLLLCFKMKYEQYKIKDLINNKKYSNYFAEIINENEKVYSVVNQAGEDLIKLIMDQKKLTFGIIKKIIFLFSPIQKVINFINKYYKKIQSFCQYENKMSYYQRYRRNTFDFGNRKLISKEDKIVSPIYDLITNYCIKDKKYNFVLFSDDFYRQYFNSDEVKIILIDESIFICMKFQKKFEEFKNAEFKNYSINSKKVKNNEFLECLENDLTIYEKIDYEIYIYPGIEQIYYYDNFDTKFLKRKKTQNKNSYVIGKLFGYFLYDISDGLEIKNMDETFLKKWNTNKDKIFELINIRYKLDLKSIISNITEMKDFEKFFTLFYIDDNKINIPNLDRDYQKNLVKLLKDKYLNLLEKNILYQNNIKLIFNIITLLCEFEINSEKLLKDIENTKSINQIIDDIYIYLDSNYFSPENINNSLQMIEHMANYIITNNKIYILKNFKNSKENIIKIIIKNINNNINYNMLYNDIMYNDETERKYFQLLQDLQKEGLVQKFSTYKELLMNILEILYKIENGEESFELMSSIYNNYDKKLIFIKKLSILLFNNAEDKKILSDCIQNYLNKINNELNYINELKEISKKYYSNIYYNNISLFNKIEKNIKKGKLNEINKNIKSDLEKIHALIPDIHK